ncbi:MAG: hypothetical protein AAFP86_06295, partial [Planctomycetota bacterium]
LPAAIASAATATATAAPTGADDCAAASAIAGYATFAFDNAAASQDGPASLCGMERDVWFRWTAAASEGVVIETCGLAAFDTVLGVYEGGGACPPTGTPLVCGDDAAGCGFQTRVTFSATAGAEYLVRVGSSVFAPAGGAGSVRIGPSCPGALPGPNVVAADLGQAALWATVGGTSAYSFTTTACNLGTEELLWIASTPEHPVFTHNVYRLEDGRLEQIGTSFAKHGYGALQSALCCDCIPAGTISRLGVGCSDPYSASTNGWQPNLAPRAEINASTGAVAFPIGSQVPVPPASGGLDRRTQVAAADLDPALHPSARYFVEAVYVAQDDAAAGNGFDNASFREFTRGSVDGSGGVRIFGQGETFRGLPAIAILPLARVDEVRVPGDGALWVASGARIEGGGAWRYELCVFNLSSHRGVSAVSLPAGAAPRDAYASYPRAHSGEPRANEPWILSFTGGRARFAAQNTAAPDANAILWATMHTFSFVSDTPPTDGLVELELWRGTGPQTVLAPARVPGDLLAVSYCTAEPNSGGGIGRLLPGEYQPLASLELSAIGLPPSAIGMVVTSTAQGFVPFAGGSDGNLCLGGMLGRSVGAFTQAADATGTFTVTADLTALPQPSSLVAVQPGDTWHFQAWHRDGPTGSNFTEAVSVVF